MRGAADRCMNIGLCRKSAVGAMCPSYMATRKEEDSTRGRANALVKALSEPDPHTALGNERLHEVLDLCLMCKACKSECPLGVDMATLKAETLAHHHEIHGIPLRSRVFGSIRGLNRLGSATAPLSNLPGRIWPLRWVMGRFLGIAPARPLPVFARRNLVRWFRGRPMLRPVGAALAASRSWPTPSPPLPNPASARPPFRCWRVPATTYGWRALAVAAGRAFPRDCSRTPQERHGDCTIRWPRPSPDRRSWVVSRPAS